MIIVPHEQLTEQISAFNRIFSCNRAKEGFYSLLEGAEHGFNQASSPERIDARIPN